MASALYKDLKNGTYLCNVCALSVKQKMWTAHVNGRKHRENVLKLKSAAASSMKMTPAPTSAAGGERAAPPSSMRSSATAVARGGEEAAPPSPMTQSPPQSIATAATMKRKPTSAIVGIEEDERIKRLKGNGDANADKIEKEGEEEEEEEESHYQPQTPWHAEVRQKSTVFASASTSTSVRIIEGVPAGFFDDRELNSRVRETVERERRLEAEYERFAREMAEVEAEKEEADDVETELKAAVDELDAIDEHIAHWRTVNELEIRKEAVVESVATARFTQAPNFDRVDGGGHVGGGASAGDNDDEEFDIETTITLDWRSKML